MVQQSAMAQMADTQVTVAGSDTSTTSPVHRVASNEAHVGGTATQAYSTHAEGLREAVLAWSLQTKRPHTTQKIQLNELEKKGDSDATEATNQQSSRRLKC